MFPRPRGRTLVRESVVSRPCWNDVSFFVTSVVMPEDSRIRERKVATKSR